MRAIDMNSSLRVTPEEHELETKQAELARLQTALAQKELDLTTLRAELRAFEARYWHALGARFIERDALKAQIASAKRERTARTSAPSESGVDPASQAHEPPGGRLLEDAKDSFHPTDTLKRLFRELAKLVHPDLATSRADRERRNGLMAEVNRAFEDGDEARLRNILEEWQTSPERVEGEGVGAELIRTIRKIHQVKLRLEKIDEALHELTRSEWYGLKQKYDEALTQGRDLLLEAAQALDAEIAELRSQLQKRTRSARTPSPAPRDRTWSGRGREWAGPRPRALVVEDQPQTRELIRRTLAVADFDVDVASDAVSAVQSLRLRTYDLLTIELKVSGGDGLSIIREAKHLKKNIAVVIMTAHPSEISAIEAINLGVAGYLTKPFKVAQVITAVVTALLRSGWTEHSVHGASGITARRAASS
ncbi:MAG: response regulator [Acidobacteria bacterium]|nr:response regulator [Acidobacteriota bacterium]